MYKFYEKRPVATTLVSAGATAGSIAAVNESFRELLEFIFRKYDYAHHEWGIVSDETICTTPSINGTCPTTTFNATCPTITPTPAHVTHFTGASWEGFATNAIIIFLALVALLYLLSPPARRKEYTRLGSDDDVPTSSSFRPSSEV